MRKVLPDRLARKIKVAACGLMSGAIILASSPSIVYACTQFWIPGDLTETGSRFVGRDEDGGTRYFKAYGVSFPEDGTTYSSGETNFTWTSDKTSYRYSFIRDAADYWGGRTDAYSAAGVNECGVSASATLSTSCNKEIAKIDPLNEESGIGEYNYVSIILGESATAREGVELIGRLIDEYGACTCDQLTISDANESWVFMVLSGHQWLAMKLPEGKVSVNPNMSNLRFEVDLDDADSCVHSEGLLTVPGNLLKYHDDGVTPDIAATYGEDDDSQGTGQNTRYGQGRAYFGAPLAEGDHSPDYGSITEPDLFFTPGDSSMSTFKALRALATRGEGTDDLDSNKNPSIYPIGTTWQMEGHMFEIRKGLPADIATVQWEAMGPTEFSVFMPIYSALITEPSPYFKDVNQSVEHSGDGNQNDPAFALEEEPEGSLDYVMLDINTLASGYRKQMASGTRAYLDALQREIIAQQELVDALLQATPADQRGKIANDAQLAVVEQTYLKCDRLLDEMRAYVRAGSFDAPFEPSDLDASTGGLKSPVLYAASVLAPQILTHPKSATYEQGAAAVDLSVSAEATDGSGILTFEWFEQAGEGEVSTGVTAPSMPVDTAKPGARSFFCRVTNAAGLQVDSEVATITVRAAEEKPPEGSGSTTDTPDAGGSQSKGDLPQTGDPVLIATASTAGLGAVSLALGAARRRSR
ncbi:MAG: C69 family dipeptidase [Collinsella sp.]|nr:C69 family dipeptidase [Collinsella sp.]